MTLPGMNVDLPCPLASSLGSVALGSPLSEPRGKALDRLEAP